MKSSMRTTARVDGGPLMPCLLEVDQEQQRFTDDSPRVSPGWKYRDGKGHEHYAAGDELPTLFHWNERIPCDGSCNNFDCDGYTVTTLWCPLCGENIKPTYTRIPRTIVVDIREHWSIILYGPVAGNEFDVLVDAGEVYLHGRATVTEMVLGSSPQVTAVGVTELERTPAYA